MDRMTRKQIDALKTLVQEQTIEHDRTTRMVMEEFVKQGLAFKNKATRRVKAQGKKRSGFMKYVPFVFYTPSPAAYKAVQDLEKTTPKPSRVTGELKPIKRVARSKIPVSADLSGKRVNTLRVIEPKYGVETS